MINKAWAFGIPKIEEPKKKYKLIKRVVFLIKIIKLSSMGIQLQLSAFQDSPEQREQNQRSAMRKRIILLVSALSLAIGARLIIKDPPPPKMVDRSKDEIRYVPGMLDALPASERVKLDPKVVAKMMEVDENARRGIKPFPQGTAIAGLPTTYKPADPLFEEEQEAVQYKQNLTYNLQRRRKDKETVAEQVDTTKTMVVQFRNGGYIRAEKAAEHINQVRIWVNRSLTAQYPTEMVSTIRTNGLSWQEPIPVGFVKMKPAKGITITIRKDTAQRISIDENFTDAI